MKDTFTLQKLVKRSALLSKQLRKVKSQIKTETKELTPTHCSRIRYYSANLPCDAHKDEIGKYIEGEFHDEDQSHPVCCPCSVLFPADPWKQVYRSNPHILCDSGKLMTFNLSIKREDGHPGWQYIQEKSE